MTARLLTVQFNQRGVLFHNCTPVMPGIIESPSAKTVITEIRAAGKTPPPPPGVADTRPDKVGVLTVVRGDDGIAVVSTEPAEETIFAYERWRLNEAMQLVDQEIVGERSLFGFPD